MSHTDKTRPWWVQMNDIPGGRRASHGCDAAHRHWAPYPCDLPVAPYPYANTGCTWEPSHAHVPAGKHFSRERREQGQRRKWVRAERTARRAMLRSLTRDASDEDVIENRRAPRWY